jgi:hypothetical protein
MRTSIMMMGGLVALANPNVMNATNLTGGDGLPETNDLGGGGSHQQAMAVNNGINSAALVGAISNGSGITGGGGASISASTDNLFDSAGATHFAPA